MFSLFYRSTKPDPSVLATFSYGKQVQAIHHGLWSCYCRFFNMNPPIKAQRALELAKETRRQALLTLYLAVASVVVVCAMVCVLVQVLRSPQAVIYAKIPAAAELRGRSVRKRREDMVDKIDKVLADCQDPYASQLWGEVTHEISELDGAFPQSPHAKCQCVDPILETPGLFHVLYHADETKSEYILAKLEHLSGLMIRHRMHDEGSDYPRPRRSSGSAWRPNWKELDKLEDALSRVRTPQQWQSRRKELLRLTHDFNKEVRGMQFQLFDPVDALDVESLCHDVPIMRDVLNRLKRFEASCKRLSPHAFRPDHNGDSKIFRCGQFDVDEFYQAALYEGASKTPVSDTDLASLENRDLKCIFFQTAHVRTLLVPIEPESSDAIGAFCFCSLVKLMWPQSGTNWPFGDDGCYAEQTIKETNEAKQFAKKALARVREADKGSSIVRKMTSKTGLWVVFKSVVVSVKLFKGLALIYAVLQVVRLSQS